MAKKKNQIKYFYQILSDIKNNIDTLIEELYKNQNNLEDFAYSKPVILKSKYPDLKKLGILQKKENWEITEIGKLLLKAYSDKNTELYQKTLANILGSYDFNGFRPYAVLCKFLFIKFKEKKSFNRSEIVRFLSLPINEAIYFINTEKEPNFQKVGNDDLIEAPRPYSYWLNYLKNAGLVEENEGGVFITENMKEFIEIFFEDLSKAPTSKKETKYKVISRGSNQQIFRLNLLKAYNEKCAISNKFLKYKHINILEAAHIIPVSHGGSYNTDNGILMTPDLHKAFDEGVFSIDENYNLLIYKDVEEYEYIPKEKKLVNFPKNTEDYPSLISLNYHKKYIFGVGILNSNR